MSTSSSTTTSTNTPTRQVWEIAKAGNIGNLLLNSNDPMKPLEGGEIRIKIHAIGLNFADIFALIGLYGATPSGKFTPGLEYSGTIEEIHEHCENRENFVIGDKVYGFTRFGAYTSRINVSEHFVKKFPDSWSFEEAAAFLVQGLTAWHGLVELGNLKPFHTVLIHSAAGGVGQIALDLCQLKGVKNIICTIGSPAKIDFLMERFSLDREQIIVRETNSKDFAEQLNQAIEYLNKRNNIESSQSNSSTFNVDRIEGYDVIMDALGGIYFKEGYKQLSRGGRMITYGSGTFMSPGNRPNWFSIVPQYLWRPMVDPQDLCSENRSVLGFNLIWLTDKVKELREELNEMLKYDFRAPYVGKTFTFAKLIDAVHYLQSGQSKGKVVVTVDC